MNNTSTTNTKGCARAGYRALSDVVRDIEAVQVELKSLKERLERLNRERVEIESVTFIVANGIKKEDVELSSGEGKPWFGTAWEFGEWLALNSLKVWAEWNRRIYYTTDLVNERLLDIKGRVCDLQ